MKIRPSRSGSADRILPATGEPDAHGRRPAAPHDHHNQCAGIEPCPRAATRVEVQRRARGHRQRIGVRTSRPRRCPGHAPRPRRQGLLRLDRARHVRRETRQPRLHVRGGGAVPEHIVGPEIRFGALERRRVATRGARPHRVVRRDSGMTDTPCCGSKDGKFKSPVGRGCRRVVTR